MARNGSGAYSLVNTASITTGGTISSTDMMATLTDIANALTGSIAKDGQTTPTANLPMGANKHTGVAAATAFTDYARADQVQNSALTWLTSVSGADTISAAATIAQAAYAAGQTFRFVSVGANTGAVTLNVNLLGAKAVTKNGTTALVSGDIPSGEVVEVVYDGTQFQLGTPLLGLRATDIGVTVQGYDADTLKANTTKTLTAGFAATPYNAGTKSSGTFTPDEANGNFQYCVNGGAFTLAPPTNNCTMILQITNNGSAGAITTSGFTKVTGTAPGTTNGDDFLAYITKINGFSHLSWQALQ